MEDSTKIYTPDKKFVAQKDENGVWAYKPNSDVLNQKKSLKKKYHDLPRFKIVLEYESNFKNSCDKYLSEVTKSLVKKLKQFTK